MKKFLKYCVGKQLGMYYIIFCRHTTQLGNKYVLLPTYFHNLVHQFLITTKNSTYMKIFLNCNA